jgi:hypothetical protein
MSVEFQIGDVVTLKRDRHKGPDPDYRDRYVIVGVVSRRRATGVSLEYEVRSSQYGNGGMDVLPEEIDGREPADTDRGAA